MPAQEFWELKSTRHKKRRGGLPLRPWASGVRLYGTRRPLFRCAMAGSPGRLSFWRNRFADFVTIPGRRRPMKTKLPMVLADRVSNRHLKLGEASCVTEMALMMACWKANEFSDSACAKEINTFFQCAAKAEAKKKETSPEESSGTLNSQQVNKLLGRYPNIKHYY